MAKIKTAYVLLLLTCAQVAAEPVNKLAKTAAVHPSAAPKEDKSTPAGPANVLFGSVPGPAPLAARAIGSYARGCLAGGVSLPINGPDWQVMRLSRDRNWGHPRLLDFLERFATMHATLITGRDFLLAICRNRAADQWSPVTRAIRSGLMWISG
jgi:murein endopeptidase